MASAGKLLMETLRRIRAHGAESLVTYGTMERQTLYTTVGMLVRSGGFAVGKQMAAEVMLAAKVELYASPPYEGLATSNHKNQKQVSVSQESWDQTSKGQRKDIKQLTSFPGTAFTSSVLKSVSLPFGGSPEQVLVQSSVLRMLAAVVETAGAVLSPSVRAQYDALALHMACCAYDAVVAFSRDSSFSSLITTAIVGLQTDALHLLSCTILSPLSHRPPFLSQVWGWTV
jgi:hypothetical protein